MMSATCRSKFSSFIEDKTSMCCAAIVEFGSSIRVSASSRRFNKINHLYMVLGVLPVILQAFLSFSPIYLCVFSNKKSAIVLKASSLGMSSCRKMYSWRAVARSICEISSPCMYSLFESQEYL